MFAWCIKLDNIQLPAKLQFIGNGAFAWCSTLVRADLPEGLTVIGDNAFVACGKLASASFPDSLTVAGKESFSRTALKNLSIPSGAKIAEDAFPSSCKITTK